MRDLPRVIPCLLIDKRRLVKTVRFGKAKYVGDPVNAVRIFNDKEVDEIAILDIAAARSRAQPDFEYVHQLASECFMPMAYGGGVSTTEDAQRLFAIGVEKVCINTAAMRDPELLATVADRFGAQSIVASIDVKRNLFGGYSIYCRGGTSKVQSTVSGMVAWVETMGAGEILINSIDRDGMMSGYDLDLLRAVTARATVPVIACGGAGNLSDLGKAVTLGGASAVAAGSLFVFSGPHKAVLITCPERQKLLEIFNDTDSTHAQSPRHAR